MASRGVDRAKSSSALQSLRVIVDVWPDDNGMTQEPVVLRPAISPDCFSGAPHISPAALPCAVDPPFGERAGSGAAMTQEAGG